MFRTINVTGDEIKVRVDVGPGRILRATLLIEDTSTTPATPNLNGDDALEKELDELLAMTAPSSDFMDDSREAIYTPDNEIVR